MTRNLLVLMLFAFGVARTGRAQGMEFEVQHHHTLKDCRGTLQISPDGVEYLTLYAKDSRKWTFDEIRALEVLSPSRISIVTYEDQRRLAGKDRVFDFTLLKGKATPELSTFLLSRVKRPMALAVLPEQGVPDFELPVKHLHTITGTTGVLKIYPDKVIYQTAREGDSRYWRLEDIERFSQPDRFRFQIVSYVPQAGGPTEVYNFQLMKDLPEGLYDYLWVRLHPSSYYPEVRQ